jgi:peptidoglycan/LPS O-acetylase OafA/YrhL
VAGERCLHRQNNRNHQFDLLRILFATLVLLSHASQLAYGASREPLSRFSGTPMTFGALGVDGFFVLSGYLIVQSWLGDPELINFLRKRVLRIFPGYLVAFALSTLIVGLLAPGIDHFFRHLDGTFYRSMVLLTGPKTPPVFPGQPFPMVNGAMYTIAYEFRCYLLVALLGLCGLFRRPMVCLAITCLLMSTLLYLAVFEHMRPFKASLLGIPLLTVRLTGIYLVGVCFHLFRKEIKFRPWFALAATAGAALFIVLFPAKAEFAMVLSGSYLMFYLGQMNLPWLSGMSRFPDISYGIYLYGFPVESLWIWFHRGSPWVTFFASTVICFGLGWLSWHMVERPALALKRRGSAKLSPGAPVPVA